MLSIAALHQVAHLGGGALHSVSCSIMAAAQVIHLEAPVLTTTPASAGDHLDRCVPHLH